MSQSSSKERSEVNLGGQGGSRQRRELGNGKEDLCREGGGRDSKGAGLQHQSVHPWEKVLKGF